MARLTYDALLLLARLSTGDEHTLTKIALDIFGGYNPETPAIPSRVAMARAIRACEALVTMKRASAKPSRRSMVAILIPDPSGGALQAQFLMNLVVRGGEERRRANDRRHEDKPPAEERRQGPRRTEPEARLRPKRIVRPYVKPVLVKAPSPFDILDRRPARISAPVPRSQEEAED